MRGKVSHFLHDAFHVGITPAHAGKSAAARRLRIHVEDHPRACGEKNVTKTGNRRTIGSPPRMRGKAGGYCHTSK